MKTDTFKASISTNGFAESILSRTEELSPFKKLLSNNALTKPTVLEQLSQSGNIFESVGDIMGNELAPLLSN